MAKDRIRVLDQEIENLDSQILKRRELAKTISTPPRLRVAYRSGGLPGLPRMWSSIG